MGKIKKAAEKKLFIIRETLKEIKMRHKYSDVEEMINREIKANLSPERIEVSFKFALRGNVLIMSTIEKDLHSFSKCNGRDLLYLHKRMKREAGRKKYVGCSEIRAGFFMVSYSEITE